jgi:thiamine biosynthesis lipoprotein
MRLNYYSQTKLALGSDVTLEFVANFLSPHAESVFVGLWRQVYSFERQFSRFLPASELSMFNRAAGLKTPINPEFKALLLSAQTIGQKTNGLYNPFILPALQRAGYKQSAVPGYEADAVDDYSRKAVVTIDKLVVGKDWASIPHGTAIDVGGCGKGYLADQLRQALDSPGIKGYRLSLGGDIATAGQDQAGKNWLINIQDASSLAGESDWVIDCPPTDFAVATSGTFRRKNQSGTSWHHIIDPIILKPAITDVRLATVCAKTALEADVLASCAVLLGSQKAPAFLKRHGVKAALLQCQDGSGIFEKQFGRPMKQLNKVAEHA